MSTLELVFYIIGAIATLLFVAGYIRGTKTALATYDDESIEVNDSGDIQHFWLPIGLAVIAAAAIIGLVGVVPAFVYVGPALAIFTAAMNGIAFFVEEKN
jgi:ABC-type branched-subunit amino acid transport system permease subunit